LTKTSNFIHGWIDYLGWQEVEMGVGIEEQTPFMMPCGTMKLVNNQLLCTYSASLALPKAIDFSARAV
jgi:hypothetical protein